MLKQLWMDLDDSVDIVKRKKQLMYEGDDPDHTLDSEEVFSQFQF